MKISVGIYPNQPAGDVVATGVLADELGFSTAWVADSHLLWREVYTLLGAMAISTSRIRLATAVTNPLTRHLTITASALATLSELSNNRAMLGISVGDSALRTMNLKTATVARLEEAVAQCRSLWAGREVSFAEGETAKLHHAGRDIPVYIAATGPKMLALSGRVADGVILMNGVAPDLIEAAIGLVRKGEKETGRKTGSTKVVVWAACHPDPAAVKYNVARAVLRKVPGVADARTQQIAAKIKLAYNYEQHGSAEADFAQLVPDDLVPRFAFSGTRQTIARQIDALKPLGVDEVALAIPFAPSIASRDDVMRDLAPDLLREI